MEPILLATVATVLLAVSALGRMKSKRAATVKVAIRRSDRRR